MDETQFLILIKEHQGIIHKICRLYRDILEDREDLFRKLFSSFGNPIRLLGTIQK